MGVLAVQTIDPLIILLGDKFANLGLRKLDREANIRLKNFKKFTHDFITKRLAEVESKYEGKQMNTP